MKVGKLNTAIIGGTLITGGAFTVDKVINRKISTPTVYYEDEALGSLNDELELLYGATMGTPSGYSTSNYEPGEYIEGDGYIDAGTDVHISQVGVDLIIDHEIGGESYYRSKLVRPTYPGGASGVTIGIGYDLGYNSPAQIKQDWTGIVDDATVERLISVAGLKRGNASARISSLSDINIPYEAAKQVFANKTLPRYVSYANKAFPGMDKIHPHGQGALVSLVFNRGSSLSGNRRREMLNIRNHIIAGDYSKIPEEFRNMKRIWEGTGLNGLLRRRDEEAKLFEAGL